MRARSRVDSSQPDRQFLFWVLTGLVAGTMVSGLMAVVAAVTIGAIQ